MAVKYVLAERKIPLKPEGEKKWYAQAKSGGELTFRKLGKEIAEGSTTVSDTDVMAVLNDLVKILRRHLDNGEIVRFGDFGSFQVTLGSTGVEKQEEFHASMIKSKRVTFRPGIDLKEMLNNLKFEKTK
ncbi:MAG: HU family DNA-binding protein [Lentimicrobiaceae bacterium]|nr:HU family DNA-binding protein [Lentimicrobiaceae bacterium]